jgi:hypothetical protein
MKPTDEVEIDTSDFPLIVARYPAAVSDEGLSRYLDALEALGRSGEAVAVMVDTRDSYLTPRQRQVLGRSMTTTKARIVACATVIRSPISRGVMTALLWMVRPPFEVRTFSTAAEARTYCLDRLRERGGSLRATG